MCHSKWVLLQTFNTPICVKIIKVVPSSLWPAVMVVFVMLTVDEQTKEVWWQGFKPSQRWWCLYRPSHWLSTRIHLELFISKCISKVQRFTTRKWQLRQPWQTYDTLLNLSCTTINISHSIRYVFYMESFLFGTSLWTFKIHKPWMYYWDIEFESSTSFCFFIFWKEIAVHKMQ